MYEKLYNICNHVQDCGWRTWSSFMILNIWQLNAYISNESNSDIIQNVRRGSQEFQLTGQNLVKTKISPLGSTLCLAARVSITIDLAGNHEFTWNRTLCKGGRELSQKTKEKVKQARKNFKPLIHVKIKKKVLEEWRLTFKNSLPARAMARWKATFSFSDDWSGSVQSKFSLPTLEDKWVLFTNFGGWSVSYWLIPLSIASIAWYN